MAFQILATLDAGKPTEQSGWARDCDEGLVMEFSEFSKAEAVAIDLHTRRASSRITYAVEEVK